MILVFGKNGQVARELARTPGGEKRFLSRAEADLRDPAMCSAAILAARPSAVINAAAWTAVDAAEAHEAEARVINAESPGAMAITCAGLGIPFCHVSTDYVFDGTGQGARVESDPVAPQNAYGRTKLAGEEAVRAAGGLHAILRTSWVFSAHGANFVKSMLRLSETRDALRVVDDQVGGPTPAADIAAALVTIAGGLQAGQGSGTWHFSGAPAVSWAGFARETFAQAGKSVSITGISTEDYPTPASRPMNSRLDCAKLRADFGITQPAWKDGLALVLKELGI